METVLNDLIIGAYNTNNAAGASYVIFGDRRGQLILEPFTAIQGNSLIINSSLLNSTYENAIPSKIKYTITNLQHCHFELVNQPGQGVTSFTQLQVNLNQILFVQDGSCFSPSYQISTNDGGIAFTPYTQSNITFILIGPIISQNIIIVNQGQTIVLTQSNLNTTDSSDVPSNLRYTVNSVLHGQFSLVSSPGLPIAQFNQSQVNSGSIQFISDGSIFAPNYTVTVQDGCGLSSNPQAANILFNLSPSLVNNSLTIDEGGMVVLSNNILSAVDPDDISSILQFTASGIRHGKFTFTTSPGVAVSQFYQGNITNGLVKFVHDGSCLPPAYTMVVMDPHLAASSSSSANITFVPFYPIITRSTLRVNSQQAVVLTPLNLNTTDPADSFPNLHYTVTSLQHGQFSTINSPSIPILQFTQQQVNDGSIQFVSDSSGIPPGYTLIVQDSCGLTSNPLTTNVNFYLLPSLGGNHLSISEGQEVVLNSNNLNSTSPNGVGPSGLLLTVSSVQHGHFEFITHPGQVINSFTQQQINSDQVCFIQDGSCNGPSYQTSVFDGGPAAPSSPMSAIISFSSISPMITTNKLFAIAGQTSILTPLNLNMSDPGDTFANLHYSVTSVQHGQFSSITSPSIAIAQFTQGQVNAGIIQFSLDSSGDMPSYTLTVQDSCGLTSPSSAANISFHPFPKLFDNQLTINQGQTVILTSDNLNATKTSDPTESNSLQFTVSNVQHGQFALLSNPGSAVTNFYQKNISSGVVEFIHDGSVQAPSFSTAVGDGLVSTAPSPATIDFTLNPVTEGSDTTVRNSIIGGSISGGMGLFFLLLKIYLEKKANEYINNQTQKDEFREKVVIPIAKEVSSQIKIAGFLGYVSEDTTRAYVTAIIEIIHQLQNRGIDVKAQMAGDPARTRLLNQITRQTRLCILGESACCSSATFSNFFCPEITPEQIESKASVIAEEIKKKLADIVVEPSKLPLTTIAPSTGAAASNFENIALTEVKTRAEADQKETSPVSVSLGPTLTQALLQPSSSGSSDASSPKPITPMWTSSVSQSKVPGPSDNSNPFMMQLSAESGGVTTKNRGASVFDAL